MAVKSILCLFGGGAQEQSAMNVAFQLGKLYGAHIRFVHLTPDLASYIGLYADGMMVNAEMIDTIQKDNQARMEKAKHLVATGADHHDVPLDKADAPLHHASASFKQIMGIHDYVIAGEGRLSDLIIVGRSDDAIADVITPALFDTGRPVLLMPPKKNWQWQDKIIALAWDSGLPAARALYNALPLIGKAEKLFVLCGREADEEIDLEAEKGVQAYLQTHGLSVQIIRVTRGDFSLPESLLARAKDLKADMLIMGAYGHSQFREMVLGGVTEFMLKQADIPLMLSH